MKLSEYFTSIANAIRAVRGNGSAMKAADIPANIHSLLTFYDAKSAQGGGSVPAKRFDDRNRTAGVFHYSVEGVSVDDSGRIVITLSGTVSDYDTGESVDGYFYIYVT